METSVPGATDPKVAMARELLGRVADKWTLLVIEELHEERETRFKVSSYGASTPRCPRASTTG